MLCDWSLGERGYFDDGRSRHLHAHELAEGDRASYGYRCSVAESICIDRRAVWVERSFWSGRDRLVLLLWSRFTRSTASGDDIDRLF